MKFVHSFYFMESKTISKIHIFDASLFVRRTKMSPDMLLTHARMLSKTTTKKLSPYERRSYIHGGIVGKSIAILRQLPK